MYSREQLVEKLNAESAFVDIKTVSDYIKKYKIDPVYENSQGVEYYDDLAFEKLQDLITSNAKDNTFFQSTEEPANAENFFDELAALHEQTARELEMLTSDKNEANDAIEKSASEISAIAPQVNHESTLSSFKLDVTQQTLTTIATTMAEKITANMISFLKEGDMAGLAIKLGKSERENQILKVKIQKLVEENKKLRDSLAKKENELIKFKPFFGGLYKKSK